MEDEKGGTGILNTFVLRIGDDKNFRIMNNNTATYSNHNQNSNVSKKFTVGNLQQWKSDTENRQNAKKRSEITRSHVTWTSTASPCPFRHW